MKLKLLKTEDNEIYVLNEDYPKFICKVNTIIPFDVSFTLVEVIDRRDLDVLLPDIQKFVRKKITYDEL